MATAMIRNETKRQTSISRRYCVRVEELLRENYAYMDSPMFRRKNIEKELFTFDEQEPALPMTSWYQPTRDEVLNVSVTVRPSS